MSQLHFKIIVPFFNVEKWIDTTIRSIQGQSYTDYEVLLIDDLSTDRSTRICQELTAEDPRFRILVNTEKKLALRNIVEGIRLVRPRDEDVIILLDGDDWLANPGVLDYLVGFYGKNDAWFTYGSYRDYPSGNRGWMCYPILDEVHRLRAYRSYPISLSHLRTFKYRIWKQIQESDLQETSGCFYRMAWDQAINFPLLEMAGHHAYFIDEVLSIYNIDNPLNDYKVDRELQRDLGAEIRLKPKYPLILPEDQQDSFELLTNERFDVLVPYLALFFAKKGVKCSFVEEMLEKQGELLANEVGDSDSLAKALLDHSPLPITYSPSLPRCDLAKELPKPMADRAALEYSNLKSDSRFLSIFGSDEAQAQIHHLLEQQGYVYHKQASFTPRGRINLIKNLYEGDRLLNTYPVSSEQAQQISDQLFHATESVSFYLIDCPYMEALDRLKPIQKELESFGGHPHLTQGYTETRRMARALLNENSLQFLNTAEPEQSDNFKALIKFYRLCLGDSQDPEDFCILGQAVEAASGRRDCMELEYLHLGPQLETYRFEQVRSANATWHNTTISKEEAITDPRYHFYFFGLKFAIPGLYP